MLNLVLPMTMRSCSRGRSKPCTLPMAEIFPLLCECAVLRIGRLARSRLAGEQTLASQVGPASSDWPIPNFAAEHPRARGGNVPGASSYDKDLHSTPLRSPPPLLLPPEKKKKKKNQIIRHLRSPFFPSAWNSVSSCSFNSHSQSSSWLRLAFKR